MQHFSHLKASHHRRRGLTLIQWVLILGLLIFIVLLFAPRFRNMRPVVERINCQNQMRQVVLALEQYMTTYDSYPPAFTTHTEGKPLHSWRTLILPYMEQQALYNSIDLTKPWDDPANALAAQTTIPQYRCPSAKIPENHTLTMGVIGPNAFFNSNGQPRQHTEITDKQTATLMLIEVDIPHSTHWMAPQDADEQLILSLNKESKLPHPGGMAQTAFADRSIRTLNVALSQDTLKAMITINGGEEIADSDY